MTIVRPVKASRQPFCQFPKLPKGLIKQKRQTRERTDKRQYEISRMLLTLLKQDKPDHKLASEQLLEKPALRHNLKANFIFLELRK